MRKTILLVLLFLVLALPAYATQIVVSPFQATFPSYPGTYVTLKLYSNLTFTDSTGKVHLAGVAGSLNGAFLSITCSNASGVITCPQSGDTFEIPSTTDSLDRPQARITAQFFDSRGQARDVLFANWLIPSDKTPLLWSELVAANVSKKPPLGDTYATFRQLEELLALFNPAPKATTAVSGIGRTSVNALDVNDPIFVGDPDPRVNQVFNVKYYGAVCNGVFDDSDGIRAARAAIVAAGGGTLYFPNNQCKTSETIVVTSNMHVKGEGASFPDPVANQYVSVILGGTIIHYTGSTSLFLITDNTINYSIEGLGAYADNPAAIGVKLQNTNTVTSLPAQQGKFSNLQFWGFARAISLDANTIDWQCDSVQVENLTASNCDQCIYINSQNGHNWHFTKTKVSPNAGGVGVWLQKSAPITFDSISGETISGASLFYFTAAHLIVDINHANAETFTRFIDTAASAGEVRYALAVRNSLIEQPVRFQQSAVVTSENNTYWGAGYFTSTGLATDMRVFSRNDTVIDGNGGARLVASPFYIGTTLQMAGNSCVDEDNWYRSHKGCALQGLTLPASLGVGFGPAIPAQSLDVRSATSIQIMFGDLAGAFHYTLGRSVDTGDAELLGNQLGFTRLKVNGTIYSSVGGFKFPDNSTQATAGVLATRAINTTSPITGGGNLSADRTIACSTCGVTSSPLSQFFSTTSAQLAGVISDETGTNKLVYSDSPTLVTPVLGVATGTSLVASGKLSSTGGISNFSKGANVASASSIVPSGNVFHVTGTTTITSIDGTGIAAGTKITIIFDGVLTLTDGGNLKLAGNFVTTADDVAVLVWDGSAWYEQSRSIN